MSLHIFGSIITGCGCAANNRGETEGNITTLQKILWNGQVHTTVSSEAIRWALRYFWQCKGIEVNRVWNDDKDDHEWRDSSWAGWQKGHSYIDDDLLGYMVAEGAKVEGEKGSTLKRRGVLEIARAISLNPYAGDISFNAKSGVKGRTSLYGTEIHATRYQYGFALTPQRLKIPARCLDALDALVGISEVAGNHSRFLFDFSPESVVFRISDDPAPRILYCFEEADRDVNTAALVQKVIAGDIPASELYVGGRISSNKELQELGLRNCWQGVRKAVNGLKAEIKARLGLE
ncbi:MAG: type I-B CRISPR-associated protein Cas7/Cst2/DevR [Syntrophobacteraceae bacterium]